MYMSKYSIENPTMQKVLDRGYEPVRVWLGGWYNGWRVKQGYKWQYIYIISTGSLKKFKVTEKKKVKPLESNTKESEERP